MFFEGCVLLIVCNLLWLFVWLSLFIECVVYDFDSCMLCGFLDGLVVYLELNGEGWLILLDFVEYLGLCMCDVLLVMIDVVGL